jgi:hypothetical protein
LTLVENDDEKSKLKSIYIEVNKNFPPIIMLKKNDKLASSLQIESDEYLTEDLQAKITNFGLYLRVLDRNANLTGRLIDFKSQDSSDSLNYDLQVRGDSCSGHKLLTNAKLTGNMEESTVKVTLSYSNRSFNLPRPASLVFKHLFTPNEISSDLDLDLPTTIVNHKLKFLLNSEDNEHLKLAQFEFKRPDRQLAEKIFFERVSSEELKFGIVNFDLDLSESETFFLHDLYNLDRQNLNEFVIVMKVDGNHLNLIGNKNKQAKLFEINIEVIDTENSYYLSELRKVNPKPKKIRKKRFNIF